MEGATSRFGFLSCWEVVYTPGSNEIVISVVGVH